MVEYTLTFVESMPAPLDSVEHDQRTIDTFYHVAEMRSIAGQNRVEYGGESPWTHVWRGSIPDPEGIDALGLPEDASTRERVEHEVDRLMTFLPTESATPHNTSPSDFEWSVFVHDDKDRNPVVNGRRLLVVWEPLD